jgi:uncharacterized DUF497 family protein
VIYEWDEGKRRLNLAKHGLDFLGAARVLESEYVQIVDSPRRGQPRQQAFAYVFDVLAVLTVAFVQGEGRCRVLSFRPANRRERESYHDWLENHFPDC